MTTKTEQSQSILPAFYLSNEGCQASLEIGKIYQVIVGREASTNGLIRVIDESGEDYAFAASQFYPIAAPRPVAEVLLSVG